MSAVSNPGRALGEQAATTTVNEREIKALVSLITDSDPEVREHVYQQLSDLGNEAIPYLVQALDDANFDPDYQERIIDMVHALQYQSLLGKLETWALLGGDDLLEGMWLVAQYQYPDLDLQKLRLAIDKFYYEAWQRMRDDFHPYDSVRVLNEVLLQQGRLGPNSTNFHSPGNSMINVVLDSGRGNPISLCVIYLLVAKRLGLPIYGVNLPNMFILTWKQPGMQFYINVFNKGIIFSKQDIQQYVRVLKLDENPIFFEPCTHLDIIRRVLRNLIAAFEHLNEDAKAEEVKKLLGVV